MLSLDQKIMGRWSLFLRAVILETSHYSGKLQRAVLAQVNEFQTEIIAQLSERKSLLAIRVFQQ